MEFLQTLDANAFETINGHVPHPLALLALAISWMGSLGGVVGWLAIVFVGLRRHGQTGVTFCAAAVACAYGVTFFLKHLVARDRPWTVLHAAVTGPHETSFSFPSGHTTASFALATAVAIRWPAAGRIAFALAALVGLSRVAVGMHYPSDVLAGALVGVSVSTLLALAWPRPEGVLGRRVVIS